MGYELEEQVEWFSVACRFTHNDSLYTSLLVVELADTQELYKKKE